MTVTYPTTIKAESQRAQAAEALLSARLAKRQFSTMCPMCGKSIRGVGHGPRCLEWANTFDPEPQP